MGAKAEIVREIYRYIPRKIGTNIYVNSISEVSGTNKIVVSIGISVPRIIYDDLLQKQYIKFTKFDNIYDIEFEVDKEGRVITVINPSVIYDKFQQSHDKHNI